jgi:translocation and assembly module TamA
VLEFGCSDVSRPTFRRFRRCGLFIAPVIGIALCTSLAIVPAARAAEPAPAETSANAIKYETKFAVPDNLKKLLVAASELESLKAKPPLSLIGLRRRAETDAERLTEVLHSEGYYAGKIGVRIVPDSKPAAVTVTAEPGPRYKLADFTIVWTGCGDHCPDMPGAKSLGAVMGDPAIARTVVAAEQKLLQRLHDSGRPFAKVADRHAVVDHAQRTLSVTETIAPGPVAHYGPLVFRGRTRVKERYIRRLVPWKEGDLYSESQVEDFQRTLVGTGLFRTAVVEPAAEQPNPDGKLPIRITLRPAKQRTVGAGLDYSTAEGPGGRLFWEHRNLFGNAENLRITLTGNKLVRSLEFALAKPQFRRRDQTLKGDLLIQDANTDAYKERGIESRVGLERPLWPSLRGPLGPQWKGSLGVSLTAARIEDKVNNFDQGERMVYLVGLPAQLNQDSSDNLLDPTKGTRLALSVTPEGGTIDGQRVGFVKNEAIGSGYYTLGKLPAFTMALRARVGSIVGAKNSSLPANRRFYAGGGGSVRGYKYQKVGPLDSDNDPLGGRSVVELSTELRIRITKTLGIVPFIDGGQVYESAYPKFSDNLLWAGGLGFRYYSPVGPIRVDFATPINGRSNDDRFQFYISLGQAF